MTRTEQIVCIVVHHESPGTLPTVLDCLQREGVHAARIVVVDNSSVETIAEVRPTIASSVADVLEIPNGGYANAVNVGVRYALSKYPDALGYLVLTHEVVFTAGSVEALCRALSENDWAVAVGPVLTEAGADGDIWSSGGYLTTWLRLPRHIRLTPSRVAAREWLDGAAVLYRPLCFTRDSMDEVFFLYMEEVDFHLRLASRIGRVAVVPSAVASQTTSGQPPYFALRNIQIFQRRWGRRGFRIMATGFVATKILMRSIIHRDNMALRQGAKGLLAGRGIR